MHRSRCPSRRCFLQRGAGLALTSVGLPLLAGCAGLPFTRPAKVARIGVLLPSSQGGASRLVEVCRQGLRDLGYVEGQTFTLDPRYAEGNLDRFPDLADELVRLAPDVILAGGTPAIAALKAATRTIPIVMFNLGDPVGGHLVASLARPGGNLTGVSGMTVQLSGKRLQLLAEAVPGTTRVAAIWDALDDSMAAEYGETRLAGQTLGIEVLPLTVRRPDDFARVYEEATTMRLAGVVVIANNLLAEGRTQLVELALRNRLPTISSDAAFAAAGGLMSYGPNAPELQQRTVAFIDKILKGAKPADLPVEQPTKFDFVLNLKTAQAIGLTIPRSVLEQATDVIQ